MTRPLTMSLGLAALLAGCAKGKDPPTATPLVRIEAGTFTMGTDAIDPCGNSRVNVGGGYALGCDAKDQSAAIPHQVALDAFCIDRNEVTNLQYRHCEENDVCGKPESTNVGAQGEVGFIKKYYSDPDKFGDYPVVGVSWENAQKYCEFHGGTLPTEAQWEFAASSRGAQAGVEPIWVDPATTEAIEAGACDSGDRQVSLGPCTGERVRAVATSRGDKTAEGVYDLAGNVREWVRDEFDFLGYCAQDGITDEFTLKSEGTRPFFSPDQGTPPASVVTDTACLDDGMGNGYAHGCNKGFLECRGVCARAFRGNDSGAEKRAAWRADDCRVRHLAEAGEGFIVPAGAGCAADCEGRGQDAQACADYCGCLDAPVDATFNDTACLQDCLGEYQLCSAACTVPDARVTCMEVATGGNDPVLPRPVCVARTDHRGDTVHTRPAAFDIHEIKGSHVVRGGSFNEGKICAGRVARRDFEDVSNPLLGFRCVYPASACQ
ncbi:MAG: formylglycine-generating enzyme family protein [Myxococcales bacterium]|nr:formylglycine-generating enzyme family protein [Myxococcales bacterium]